MSAPRQAGSVGPRPERGPARPIAPTAPAPAAGAGADNQPLRQLQAVVDLLPMAIWIAEGDRIHYANKAAVQLTHAPSRAAITGRSVSSLLHADAHAELHRQIAAVLARPGTAGTLRARLLRPDAERCEVEIALTALPDHGKTTVQMVVHDITQRQRELQELQESRQALRRLSANIVEGREAERRRIARELHDELGQGLSALKLELSACVDDALLDRHRERVDHMLQRLDEIMAAVRRIAVDLRPQMLDDLGLSAAVEWLVQDFARHTGLRCTMQLDDIGALDDRAGIALYRMVQEALTNVLRHAQATAVHVELQLHDGHAQVSVRDNGVGLRDTASAPLHDSQFGLLGMRERADMLGGVLQLERLESGGTCVRMELPLRARHHGSSS